MRVMRLASVGLGLSLLIASASRGLRQSPPPPPTPTYLETLDWQMTLDFPSPTSPADRLWAVDEPKLLGPMAFGRLPSELWMYITRPNLSEITLGTPLPESVDSLPVYVIGVYPEMDPHSFLQKVDLPHPDCQFFGRWAEITCVPTKTPTGATQVLSSASEAEQRAQALIQRLWMPDLTTTAVYAEAWGWKVVFRHHIGGRPIFSDRALQVHLNRDGQLLYLVERRRPAIAQSLYPLRSPSEAWESVRKGHHFALDIIWGAQQPKENEPFVVSQAEIGYVITHGNAAREIMQPYYVFFNDKRQAIFVPAVAEEYVTWPVGR